MDILLYKGAKSRPTILLESRTKNFTRSQLTRFVLLHQRSLLHTIVEVLLKDSFRKESFPRIELDTKALAEYIFRLQSRHHQLLFNQNMLLKDC